MIRLPFRSPMLARFSRGRLPASRFPTLAAYGTYAWINDRDQRFNSGLDTLFRGLQADFGPAAGPSTANPPGK